MQLREQLQGVIQPSYVLHCLSPPTLYRNAMQQQLGFAPLVLNRPPQSGVQLSQAPCFAPLNIGGPKLGSLRCLSVFLQMQETW